MLWGNYSVLNKSAGKWISGGATGQGMYRSDFNHTNSMMNIFFQDNSSGSQTADLSAIPNGYLPPYSWLLPLSSGGMASFTNVVGTGSYTNANLAGGLNAFSTISGSGAIYNADLVMIIWLLSTISASGVLTSDITGKLEAFASILGESDISNANLIPILWGLANISGSASINADITGALDAIATLSASGSITSAILLSTLSAICSIAGTSSLAAGITGMKEMAILLTGAGDVTSTISAIGNIVSEIVGESTFSGSVVAKGFMEADITPFTELSPQNLAIAVWESLAALYTDETTMGGLLNMAASGSPSPSSTISASTIWAYETRTLTSGSSGGGGATAEEIWEYPDRQLTSLQSLVSQISTGVWNYVTRTLSAFSQGDILDDTDITCRRGDTFTYAIEGLDFTDYSKVYFTIKQKYSQADAESTVQVDSTTGLLYLNGAVSASPAQASLAVTDSDSATLMLKPYVTASIPFSTTNYVYDIQIVYTTGVVRTLQYGDFILARDVTRRTS